MKAKLVTAILALSLAIPAPVYADRTDDQIAKIEKQIEILQAQLDKLKKKKEQEAPADSNSNSIEYENLVYSFVDSDVITQDDKMYAVLYFDFTNNSSEIIHSQFTPDVFQNGVQVDQVYLTRTGIAEIDNLNKQITPGTTIRVAHTYSIEDMGELFVHLRPKFDFGSENFAEFTVNLM